MENQPTKLNKVMKISIIAGALIVALSVAYYLVIFLPQKTRVEQQKQEQLAKRSLDELKIEGMKITFEKVKSLMEQGKETEATEILSNLTENEMEILKLVKLLYDNGVSF